MPGGWSETSLWLVNTDEVCQIGRGKAVNYPKSQAQNFKYVILLVTNAMNVLWE